MYRLEEEGQFERAAALSVFYFDLKRAIISLNKGNALSRDFNFQLVSMALAGCSEAVKSGSTFWRETCFDPNTLSQLNNPYLRVCFLFLCAEAGNFSSVIEDPSLRLSDRIAFACRFLDDSEVLILKKENVLIFFLNPFFFPLKSYPTLLKKLPNNKLKKDH